MRQQNTPTHEEHAAGTDPVRAPDQRDDPGYDESIVTARPKVADPPPQPTAFGAPTVAGAVAASAMAGVPRAEEPDVSDEETVAPHNGAVEGGEATTRRSQPPG